MCFLDAQCGASFCCSVLSSSSQCEDIGVIKCTRLERSGPDEEAAAAAGLVWLWLVDLERV